MDDSMVGLPFPASLLVTNPDPSSITEENWGLAEQASEEVVRCILPTLDTDETRRDIIDYVQTLIRNSVGCEVFSYGSVPLKTYLTDGDIDLTALSIPSMEESLIRDVLAVLMEEEQNENAQYELKDTQFIDAEVKLVKCLVQNIVIDISFNQLGGLCTLCFLEQIDRNVGKDHLFKRSIILVKVWCYYESRVLGGHHGLLSTYALETLVLVIFHLFNSSLNGPLMVLYRFLDYFSKFDWENNCISLNGPVCKSSLPDITAEKPEIGGDGLMLSGDFLRNCVEIFSVPSRGLETDSRPFPLKHLNIIDPLKESNNLGRSVSRGNYYRIRSAFKHGARKLGRILQSPRERIAYEIKKFFANTAERHGYKYGADIQNGSLIFGIKGLGTSSSSSHTETFSEDELHLKSSVVDFDDDVPEVEDKSALRYGHDASENDINGHANDLAAFRFLSLQDTNQTTDCSPPHSNFSGSHAGKYHCVPHSYFSDSSKENGTSCQRNVSDSVDLWLEHKGNNWAASDTASLCYNNCEDLCSIYSGIPSPGANSLESLSIDFGERGLAGIDPDIESLNPLADLSGDYDSHIRSLLYAQRLHGWNLSTAVHVKRTPHTSPSQVLNTNPWDITGQSVQRCPFSQMNLNGAAAGPSVFYPANNSTSSAAQFGLEEGYIQHGTGTYIPNMNFYSVRERSSQGRRWNHAPASITRWRRLTRNNSSANAVSVTNKLKEGDAESSVQGRESRNSMEANAKLESGFHGLLPEASSKLPVNQQCSTSRLASPEMHRTLKPLLPCTKQQGIVETFFHLKSEQDFPSLHRVRDGE